jgi:hypothetical protein
LNGRYVATVLNRAITLSIVDGRLYARAVALFALVQRSGPRNTRIEIN